MLEFMGKLNTFSGNYLSTIFKLSTYTEYKYHIAIFVVRERILRPIKLLSSLWICTRILQASIRVLSVDEHLKSIIYYLLNSSDPRFLPKRALEQTLDTNLFPCLYL